MQTNDPVFEDVKNYFSFALRGAFVDLDGMELTKIYYMFLTGIELTTKNGHCRIALPIGMDYFYAMHVFLGYPAPPWEEDPFIKIRFTGEHIEELLHEAKIKISAWMAARELAIRLLEQEDPVPEGLRSFLVDINGKTKPKRNRGRHFHDNFFRDYHIVLLLSSVDDTHLPITRNPDPMYKQENSLCDAMKRALESIGVLLSYAAIRSIWYKRETLKKVFQEFPSPFNLLINSNMVVLNK